jgi:hypothetical protein
MKPYDPEKEITGGHNASPFRRTNPPAKRPIEKPPADPERDEYLRPDTEDYARRQYLLKQTPLSTYLPPNLQTGDSRQDEMFTRFSAAWIANTANSAAVSLNRYFVADLQLAAAQQQTATAFEKFFQTPAPKAFEDLTVLNSRRNLIQKVRQIHGIKGAHYHLDPITPSSDTTAERVESMINHAQRELEQDPATLNAFTRTLTDINEKMAKRETVELLRAVQGEADRTRYPNGPAVYQHLQHLQQSDQAATIREENQYIELIQTRDNYQFWCNEKTGAHAAIDPNRRDPRQEDANYQLKLNIANFLYDKLQPIAETLEESPGESKRAFQALRNISDTEFLRGIEWKTQGKTIHPHPQQIQMMREALTNAATVLQSNDPTHLREFLETGNKNNTAPTRQQYNSRAMKILWIAGAEAPCKLGTYKTSNRKLHTDLHLAFQGTVLERLIHLIKNNFRWFAQLQQLVMINRQLATIHKDLNPVASAAQDQHTSSLRSMPRI